MAKQRVDCSPDSKPESDPVAKPKIVPAHKVGLSLTISDKALRCTTALQLGLAWHASAVMRTVTSCALTRNTHQNASSDSRVPIRDRRQEYIISRSPRKRKAPSH